MSKTVFCQCDRCLRDIHVGETMITLSKQTEHIENESTVQPKNVNVVGTWCEECAESVKFH